MSINESIKNKTLVITGGTGSFGSTVLKHFLTSEIGEIRIISRDEKKQDSMRHTLQRQGLLAPEKPEPQEGKMHGSEVP